MHTVFANRSGRGDFIANEIQRLGMAGSNVYIAVAFFTEAETVKKLLDRGCQIQMVVRLGFPTRPSAIDAIKDHPRMQLRVYTSTSFHPKLYIFGDEAALVGSANLTGAAILSNQEVVVRVDADDQRFDDLAAVFDDYWDQAEVPSKDLLERYKKLYAAYEKHEDACDELARKAAKELGDTAPPHIVKEKRKPSKGALFVSHFRRAYQEGVAAFNVVRGVYESVGYRKVDESAVPLRLEIDSFISFVREKVATEDSWKSAPIRSPAEQESLIRELIDQWRAVHWPHFEDKIVGENYPRIRQVFSSPESIKLADDGELFDALATLHSFHDRFRFFDGGLATWKKEFPKANDPMKTRNSLAYLVFGPGDVVERMANMLDENQIYKLNSFGKANVQELIGWCNREELPVINGRTTKVLRFFGSKVVQVA
ncbi:phospholipase D-like domain-containing protein [Variovorax sp.]|jgi:HKD family nuclease|uniref:phospholipase D-like domain-containing protein n=1 Tax=Variovorax sp. TaxID=1871043 RepID=UPI0037D9E43C